MVELLAIGGKLARLPSEFCCGCIFVSYRLLDFATTNFRSKLVERGILTRNSYEFYHNRMQKFLLEIN